MRGVLVRGNLDEREGCGDGVVQTGVFGDSGVGCACWAAQARVGGADRGSGRELVGCDVCECGVGVGAEGVGEAGGAHAWCGEVAMQVMGFDAGWGGGVGGVDDDSVGEDDRAWCEGEGGMSGYAWLSMWVGVGVAAALAWGGMAVLLMALLFLAGLVRAHAKAGPYWRSASWGGRRRVRDDRNGELLYEEKR